MEYVKIFVYIKGKRTFYWTWKDNDYFPYAWLDKKNLKDLPKPFYLIGIHPDCPIGKETPRKDEFTNILELPDSFDKLKLDNDLRKDLKRIEKKNEDVKIIFNEKDALEKAKKWVQEFWKEGKRDFNRRMQLWKEKCYTLSAYVGEELIAVHIGMPLDGEIYYCGCWWNREQKNRSIPTFLLKKDIERAIKEKIKIYNMGIGDEPYKKKWGVIEKSTKYYTVLPPELEKELEIDSTEKWEG